MRPPLVALALTVSASLACAQEAASWHDPSKHTVQLVDVEDGVRLEVFFGRLRAACASCQEEHRRWIEMRDTFPADLIQREVIAKGRRALLTYGSMHFQRKNIVANYEFEGPAETIVSRLENKWGAKVFTIFTADVAALQSDAASWPVSSIAIVRGTVLGARDFTKFTRRKRWADSRSRTASRISPRRFPAINGARCARKISSTPSCTWEKGRPLGSISIRHAAPRQPNSRSTCGAWRYRGSRRPRPSD